MGYGKSVCYADFNIGVATIIPGAHNEKERRTSSTSVSDKLLKMWSVFSL